MLQTIEALNGMVELPPPVLFLGCGKRRQHHQRKRAIEPFGANHYAQIAALEKSLGHLLFERIGHRLVLTDTGEVVFRYAQQIFTLGQELSDVLTGRFPTEPIHCAIGVAETIPGLSSTGCWNRFSLLLSASNLCVAKGRLSNYRPNLRFMNWTLSYQIGPLHKIRSCRCFPIFLANHQSACSA